MSRFPLPPLAESTAEWLEMRRRERNGRRRARLYLLWVLASGTASERQGAAQQPGRNR